jgi:hypothetical protein
MDASVIRVVTTDIDLEVEDAFNEWYEQHIRDVVACPGWLTATRYRSLGGQPRYLAIYDVASKAAATIGSLSAFPPEIQTLHRAGYEGFWPHIETFRARTYERISHVHGQADESDASRRVGRRR